MSVIQNKLVVSSDLIGRSLQFKTLTELVNQVRDGKGQIAMVAGEAGIGKSRLLDEIKALGQFWGFVTLQGTCLEPDGALPLAPIVDLLRSLNGQNARAEISSAPLPTGSENGGLLTKMVAQLLDLMPTIANEPKAEEHRLFESLVQVFFRMAEEAPLLITLEDLHWSDNRSLDCLLYCIHRISTQPIMLLLSFRSEELRPGFQHFRAMLKRDRRAVEVALNPLTIEDVDGMIRAVFELRQPVHTFFLDKIYRLTGGNPYFVEEVLKSLNEDGEISFEDGVWKRKPVLEFHIPLSVQDSVQRRMEQLDDAARKTLCMAAVIGLSFDFKLLQELIQIDDLELILQLKKLVEAQLVVEETANQFSFRNALTREAVYATLLRLERQKYHRLIAETLERNFSPSLESYLADLAYHFYQGALWEKALEYSQRAGEQAQAAYAPLEAVEHFSRALKSAQTLNIVPPEALYIKRGQVYMNLGDFENALADLEQALVLARQSQDRAAEWQSLTDLGILWTGRNLKKAGEFHQLANDLAQELGRSKFRGHSLNYFGNWLSHIGREEEASHAHQQALEIFQSQADKHGLAETLDFYALAISFSGDQVASLDQYQHARELFQETGDKIGYISSLASCNRSVAISETGFSPLRTVTECKHDAAQALNIARQIHCFTEQAHVELFSGAALASYGEFGEGQAHLKAALGLANEIEHHQWIAAAHFFLGRLYLSILAPELALDNLETGMVSARKLGAAFWIENISVELALTHLALGELPHAQALLEPLLPQNQPKLNLTARRILWSWGKIALALDQPAKSFQIAEQLIESAPGVDQSRPIPVLLKLKAESLVALGRPEEAQQVLKRAQCGAEESGMRPYLWQIHADLAKLQQDLEQKEQARDELIAAQEIIASLAATLEDQDLRQNFLQQAEARLPKIKAVYANNNNKNQLGGLTQREKEIVLLISEGKSNKDIAEALIVSKRTVTTHVSHILFKLGFHSRTQIAAWVAERK